MSCAISERPKDLLNPLCLVWKRTPFPFRRQTLKPRPLTTSNKIQQQQRRTSKDKRRKEFCISVFREEPQREGRLKRGRLGRVLSWPSGDVILSSLVGGGESERPRVTPSASLANGVWPGQLYLMGQRAWSVRCWGVSYLKWPASVFHLSVFVLQPFKNIKSTLRSRAYRNRPQAEVCDLCQALSSHNSSPSHSAKKRARVGSWHPEGTPPAKSSVGGA